MTDIIPITRSVEWGTAAHDTLDNWNTPAKSIIFVLFTCYDVIQRVQKWHERVLYIYIDFCSTHFLTNLAGYYKESPMWFKLRLRTDYS